jgi:hypothetical protein
MRVCKQRAVPAEWIARGLQKLYRQVFAVSRKKIFRISRKRPRKVLIFGTPAGSVIGMVAFYLLNAKGYFMKHGTRKRARASSETVAARNELIRKLKREQPHMTTAEIVREVQATTGEVITSGAVYAALQANDAQLAAAVNRIGSDTLKLAAASNGNRQLPAIDEIAAPLGDMIEASKFVQTVGSIERAILALNRIRNITNPQSNLEAIEA